MKQSVGKRPFPAAQFVRIEDRRGRLLFEYDPQRHLVRIKTRSMDRPELVDLAQYVTLYKESGAVAENC